ncbi:serine/threonine-protein kinase [Patulibacter americanus]|uniref:serine/threonine-protein kinase n=1 Tax=Patulibacter americanus TaxID=588672 RepID=UPI00146C7E9C|nr:serine/threonine-protein kinase [Patulibacter americanus]
MRPTPPGADRAPGDLVLGRYALVRIVGRGGAGTVWQAEDRNLGRVVAIKCLPSDGGDRALAEARAAARLGHPTVVGTYGLGTADGCAWLVTEFVAGDTLRRTIAEDTHTDDELLQIGVAVCVALRHAHSRGIVHRDVTPRNILVPVGAFDGTDPKQPCRTHVAPAKLADFGIARLKEAPEETRQGRIVGTLSYMAPERLKGATGDESGDLWALGVILHEAFVGEHPAGKPDKASALVRTHTDLPSLGPRRPDLPEGVVAAIDRASSTDAVDRGTVEELERALRSGLAERGVAVAPVLRESAPRPVAGPRPAGTARPRGSRPVAERAPAARASAPRPALLRAAPAAAALGAAVGPAALAALLLAALAVAFGAVGGPAARTGMRPRVAAGVALLALVAAAAGVVVPVAVAAVGGSGSGAVAAVVAFLLTAATGACLGRMRTPRSIR